MTNMRVRGAGRRRASWRLAAVAALLAFPIGPTACASQVVGRFECRPLSQARHFAHARLVIVGTMAAGPTATVRGRSVLVSPARMRVTRYLKGAGPPMVKIVTRVQNGNIIKRTGIEPQSGQEWVIFTRSMRMPYHTTTCQGSQPTATTPTRARAASTPTGSRAASTPTDSPQPSPR